MKVVTEQGLRELDAWIAEHAFGIEVEWVNGEPTRKEPGCHHWGEGQGLIFGNIPRYTTFSAFSEVKREIERRGWSWMATGNRERYEFAIWNHVMESGGVPAGFAPELGRAIAETEELSGCLTFKAAVEATRDEPDQKSQNDLSSRLMKMDEGCQ